MNADGTNKTAVGRAKAAFKNQEIRSYLLEKGVITRVYSEETSPDHGVIDPASEIKHGKLIMEAGEITIIESVPTLRHYTVLIGSVVVFCDKNKQGTNLLPFGTMTIQPLSSAKIVCDSPAMLSIFTVMRQAADMFDSVDVDEINTQTAIREQQHQYVASLRQDLAASQHLGLLRHETIRTIEKYCMVEENSRIGGATSELSSREEIYRRVIEDSEMILRNQFSRTRFEGTILPWCILGCNYCCKLQHELHMQVCNMSERETTILSRSEEAAAEALLLEESLSWRRIETDIWASRTQLSVFFVGRFLLLTKAKASRILLLIEEQKSHQKLSHQFNMSEEATVFHDDSWALKTQALEMNRQSDSLQLREDATLKAALDLVESKDEVKRQFISTRELSERTKLLNMVAEIRMKMVTQEHTQEIKELQYVITGILLFYLSQRRLS